MIEKILIPTDGSEYGKVALEYGIYVAKRLNSQIIGLHVIDAHLLQGPVFTEITGSVGLPAYQELFSAIQNRLDEKADYILNTLNTRCLEAGLKPEIKKSLGIIDETIIEKGKEADLIILARRGEHLQAIAGGILGTTAESVVRKSGKPVLVTPEKFVEIESIGLAYDGSTPADNALKLAAEISHAAAWPLTIIMITSDHATGSKLTIRIEDALEHYKIDYEMIILNGKEDHEIIKFIHDGSIELMVMGAYGHNRLREFILGSTTSYVIRKSPVPVLLVR